MTIESAKFVVQRGNTQYSCTGSTLPDKLQAGDLLVVRRGSTTYKYSYSNISDDILDSDLFVCTDTNDITYEVSGLRVKDLFGVSSITLGDPTPISSDPTRLLYNNSSVLNWTNAEKPLGDTFPKVYFLEPGSTSKNFIILDGDNRVVATTTSPTQQLPKVSEAKGTIKWPDYPLTQLIRPEIIGSFSYVCNSIACHIFSDGEKVYVGTGGTSSKLSSYYYTSNPLAWENRSALPLGEKGWGFFQVLKNDVIYVNPGDGTKTVLKSTDRGASFQTTGVTLSQKRGFGYDAAIDTFFLDIGQSYQISTDDCQTWTTKQWPISMSSQENVFQESANGFYACGGRHVLKYNPTTAEFDVLADESGLPSQCTGAAVNNLGEIIFVDINTGSNYGYAFIDANDNVSVRPLTGAGPSASQMRSIAWTDTADNIPGHFTMVGNGRVTTSEDGLNWIPVKQIANRALGIGNDPVSGNVIICGDGSPYVYLLSVNFDPNAQFANGTLTAELFNNTTLIAESDNVIDLYGVSSITLGDPTPTSSDANKLLYNNSSTLTWANGIRPLGNTFPKVYFLEPGSNTKNFIILDANNNVVATTTSPTQQLPKPAEAQTTIKWGAYPLTQLINPEVIGAFDFVCHTIACHTFSDGEKVYIGTGGAYGTYGSGKSSICYYTHSPLVWEHQSTLPANQRGWGLYQIFLNDNIYYNPGDGTTSVLKSTDRGRTFQETGTTGFQRRGFAYYADIGTFFIDIGANEYQISTDECETWTTVSYPAGITMSDGINCFVDTPNGFYACGGQNVLKYNTTTSAFELLSTAWGIPGECTGVAVNNLGEIIFVAFETGSNGTYAYVDTSDNVSVRNLTGAGSCSAMRAVAWTDTQDNIPGHYTLVGDRKVTTSVDGVNWIPAKNISNRALNVGNDPVSGNVMVCGDGSPYVYLLSVNFNPNTQFANGTLRAELFNDTTLIKQSTNVITVTP